MSVLLVLAFGYGFVVRHEKIFPYELIYAVGQRWIDSTDQRPDGWWASRRTIDDLDAESAEQLEQLLALGYAQSYELAARHGGVGRYDPGRSHPGVNLVVSAHAAEASLIDMQGKELHRWSRPFETLWPESYDPEARKPQQWWRRARVRPGGGLLAVYGGAFGIVALDRDSNVLWSREGGYHHDLDLWNDNIYVLTREAKVIPAINPEKAVLEDQITILSGDGATIRVVSLLDAFRKSVYSPLLSSMADEGDIFHSNSIQVLDGSLEESSPFFRRGNVLVSVRELDTVCIVDMEREQVVWAKTGLWDNQHDARLLASGTMIVFDNEGGADGSSRIVEIEPLTGEIVWIYSEADFSSPLVGSHQRLPGGNTLITESTRGRAFEVTSDGEIVWEYFNPHLAGDDRDHVALLMEVVRLSEELPIDWLNRESPASSDR